MPYAYIPPGLVYRPFRGFLIGQVLQPGYSLADFIDTVVMVRLCTYLFIHYEHGYAKHHPTIHAMRCESLVANGV
jgi:hypothetical protein